MANNNNNTLLTLNKRVAVIGFALREGFIALVPYFILSSISTLILEALIQFQVFENVAPVKVGVTFLKSTLPMMVLVSFTYQLAKLKAIDSTASVVLALALLITLQPFDSTMLYSTNSSFLALLIPIFSTFFLARIANSEWLLSPKYTALDDNLRMIYRYTPAFIISYIVLLGIFILIKMGFMQLYDALAYGLKGLEHHIEWMLLTRTLVSHLLTFLGVHGTILFDIFVNPSYLESPFAE